MIVQDELQLTEAVLAETERADDPRVREIVQALDDFLHGVDDLDGVPSRDAEDREVNGVLAVDRHRLRRRRPAVFYVRDVTNEDGAIVLSPESTSPHYLLFRFDDQAF